MATETGRPTWRQVVDAAPLIIMVVLAVVGAVLGTWELLIIVGGVLGCALVGQSWVRRRSRETNAALEHSGGGLWDGQVDIETAEWLWRGERRAGRTGFLYSRGLPVRLTADHRGLHLEVRGVLAARIARWRRLTIPWSDLAGARQRDQGWTHPSGTVSLLRLTRVTIDIVGESARVWNEDWSFDDDPEGADLDERALRDEQDFMREMNGPDWRPGTAPLTVTTSAPDGLVQLVDTRGTGRATGSTR